MQILHQLDLNKEYFSPRGKFFGRKDELHRLLSILGNEEGSTALIAGDRGSGKTSLIKEAMRRSSKLIAKKRRSRFFHLATLWSWAKICTVILDVPLLATSTTQEKSREAVLRMIVHTLLIEHRSKNLYQKACTPMTYAFRLRRLERTLKYSKVTHKSNGGFDFSRFDAKLTLGSAREYELDLTYADIELQLREFFKTFSRHVDFYVIFDELDKFEAKVDSTGGEAELKKPHEFIRELKNLFTTSNAKFIFTSTESYYQEISEVEQDARLSILDYKYSIFTHKILVSHFDPVAYDSYIDYLFKSAGQLSESQLEPFDVLKYKLMWVTDLYPLATKKKLFEVSQSRDDGSMYVDLVNIEASLLIRGENVDSLMYVLLRTYADYSSDNDFYFNRILYKSLKDLASRILEQKPITLKKTNALALIFNDVNFLDEKQKKRFYFSDRPQYDLPLLDKDSNSWKLQLMRRDSTFKEIINKALITFIAYLDIADFVDISQSNTDVSLVIISQTSYALFFVDTQEMMSFPLDEIRKVQKKHAQMMRSLMTKSNNAGVELVLPEVLAVKYGLGNENDLSLGWNFYSLLYLEEKLIAEQDSVLSNKIAAQIVNSLDESLTNFIDPKRRKSEHIYSNDGRRYQVLINPHAEGIKYASSRPDIDKVICINAHVREQIKKNRNIAYFKFKNNMSDYDTVMKDVKKYLERELGLPKVRKRVSQAQSAVSS